MVAMDGEIRVKNTECRDLNHPLQIRYIFISYLKNVASSSIILFQDKQTRNMAGEVKLSKFDQDKNSNYFDDFE